jgi:hypothetical protein
MTGDVEKDYYAIKPYLDQAVRLGQRSSLGFNEEGQGIYHFIYSIGRRIITVRGIEIEKDIYKIGDALIK